MITFYVRSPLVYQKDAEHTAQPYRGVMIGSAMYRIWVSLNQIGS